MSINPSQKGAIEMPKREKVETRKSLTDPSLKALHTPSAMAIGIAIRSAIAVRYNVAGMRPNARGSDGTPCQRESPKSPRTQWESESHSRSTNGRSSPRLCRSAMY
jgi:hypothetical protein